MRPPLGGASLVGALARLAFSGAGPPPLGGDLRRGRVLFCGGGTGGRGVSPPLGGGWGRV